MEFRTPRGSKLGNKLLDKAEIEQLLRSTPYCTLSFNNINGYPGATPINFAWDGEAFYFHCAPRGERVESLEHDNRVCISVYEEAGDIGQQLLSNHRCVIAYGDAELLTGEAALEPLQKISHAADMAYKADEQRIRRQLDMIVAYKVVPKHMTGRYVTFGGRDPKLDQQA